MGEVDPSKPVVLPPHLHCQAEALGLKPIVGYYDCWMDKSNGCITCCLPCITYGQVSDIVDEGNTTCLEGGGIFTFTYPLCLSCLCGCCQRMKLRHRFMVRGNCCCDCIVHCCCQRCALCQEFRELEFRGFDVPAGWRENVEAQPLAVAVFRITPVDHQIMRRS